MAQLSANDVPPSPTNAGTSSPNSCAEIAELLSRLQLNSSQLQELFVALTDIATGLNKPTAQATDDTLNVINAEDVPQDVSSSDEDTKPASGLPTTTAPSAIAAEPTIESSLAPSNRVCDTVPDGPSIVTTSPSAVTPTGAAIVVAPAAPVPIAAPTTTSTTRLFNGISYQYPAEDASGP
ncbi:uncharacterized protein LACBIDRAFT_326621 [Laccaria bicolor S238N-H82]|uniref:Predicted protein n=1 Tax=Laccaria bicolor (strain S238N-H82 / ATCC MYA-4686) TaxID=486041 RepID=B0D993_LACBS|nr:uncharacterized protein LACBIDRAFT_326621 [Laccaria bicolor S238N-H82]EDR09210.1 predicted protein [Laccaria bicolor S238N-H82]|eukprot:XP_001880523.1 predicted protein [Laccaria bicolor S238N-H82]